MATIPSRDFLIEMGIREVWTQEEIDAAEATALELHKKMSFA